tara:strand:+ start:4469 stop:5131 length:663 start_codon:yes stop_codon:yes gene_type:complete
MNSALSRDLESHYLINQLQRGLNERKNDLLRELFLQKSFKEFDKKFLAYTKKYKDTKWSIKIISNQPKKKLIEVKIKSSGKISDQIYNLNSNQLVEIETYKNKIKNYKVLNENSTLNSQGSPLIVKIISPEKVLTGERYEVNLIVEEPLDNSFLASGMIILENQYDIDSYKKFFGIKPNQSGGLFKFIQAPLKPGFQTISAIIAHPKGIYSITKKIQVGL